MQITQEQYEKISKYLPTQRGNVSMTNLQLINAILYVTENGCKWRVSPKEKPADARQVFRVKIFLPASAAVLLSSRMPNIKSTRMNWKVMMTLPPGVPISVSIST